jgi:DNA-binding MarR family transcriptional regulator
MSLLRPAPDAEPVSKTRLRLWLRLLRVTRSVEAELRENLRTEFASTLPRFDVMAALNRHRAGLKMSQLSGVLRVSNGNVTGIIERLVEDGHVIRVPVAGDRRASAVRLTPKGIEEFTRQAEAHESWIDACLSGLDPDETARMTQQLAGLMASHDDKED